MLMKVFVSLLWQKWTLSEQSTLIYLPQLSLSRFVQLKIKDSKSKLDAIKREIKNLQKTVVTMSKAIQDLKNHVDANIAKI